ncbi:MAG: hypothetical protein Q7W02_02400 [Candidatus Rokubacteria bacterium]|nr:hypothetical protein [Candidatus Rokubacteria bacterium]
MAGEAARLPLEVSDEPLVGWRCWYVLPGEGLLRPIYKRGLAWKPRQAHEAVCPEESHEVPADGCKCGIWAVCHPMLLQEVAWAFAPPSGTPRLPGVVVVGQVALWGKIVEHERGWRASAAYPRHLYALTDDPMVAETLRERYGIPVEWGEEANRLRRLLPPATTEEEEEEEEAAPALREVLLDVLRHGLAPQALVDLVGEALDDWQDLVKPPAARREAARRALGGVTSDRRQERFSAYMAHAETRALGGDSLAARRALWVRFAKGQRWDADQLWKKIQPGIQWRDVLLEDLARGVSAGPIHKGRPYAAGTLYAKRKALERLDAEILAFVPHVEALAGVTIPTYREWRLIARGIIARPAVPGPSVGEQRLWHQHAMRREARLAEQERLLRLARQTIASAQGALEAERAATKQAVDESHATLEAERAALREDVIAGVARDRAELLEEVGELERRRRAALALLPGGWPPPARPDPMSRALRAVAAHPALASRLRELGITQAQIAQLAGFSRASVCHVLAGRQKNERVLETARAMIGAAEARAKGSAPAPPAEAVSLAGAAPAPSPRDELARERAELDELTRSAAADRAKITKERRELEQARQRAESEHTQRTRATAIEESSRVAVWLPPRLKAAGISQTRIAQAAGVGVSAVCRVLGGHGTSVRVVAVANRLLAQAEARARARKTARRKARA